MTLYLVLALVVVVLIVLAILYFLQRKKARAAAPSGAAPGGDEISILAREAESKLSGAKLEQGARLAGLPVYILLGDTGSAKTSVMVHSGLDPELLAGQVYQNGNVVSTAAANFWFARRFIFVEAGGRLPADTGKWSKLVARLAPRTTVVGTGEQAPRAAIVCFDCENFTRQGAPDFAANAARNLRARLGEISQAMGINLPVYVLFTRMDRLPFFTDYVRNFSNDEAAQVLGATLPMLAARSEGIYAEEETARLTGNFEALFRSLAAGRTAFLPRENDPSKLPAEYEFPREFRKIRQTLVQFLVDLCRPSQLSTGPFLRGFYFTGVRPILVNESAPVSAAPQQPGFGSAAGATGIFSAGGRPQPQAAPPPPGGTRKVPQWLFLSHLFNDVLLADRSALSASGASTKANSTRRLLLLALALVGIVLVIGFSVSFFHNRTLETQVRDAARGISSAESTGADLASPDALRKLDTLRQALANLSVWNRDGAPMSYRWGLYTGGALYPEARRVYFARFRQLLFAQTQDNLLQFLRSLPATPGPDYSPTYDALKAYLITTSNHDKSTPAFLAPVLLKFWENGRTVDSDRAQLAQNQFEFYASELQGSNPYSPDNDGLAIEKTRRYLAQFAGGERVYAFMLAEAGKQSPPINFNRQFPGSAAVVVETHEVPGAFSKAGWNFMKDAINHVDRYFNGEPWVLGQQTTSNFDIGKLQQELKTRYSGEFVGQWREYIKDGSVVRYTSLKDAAGKLMQNSGNQAPILELLWVCSTNTAVDDPAVANIFQPVQAVVPPSATDHFIAPQNQTYVNALLALQTAVEQIADQPGPPDPNAASQSITAAAQAKMATRQMAQTFRVDANGHIESAVQNFLEAPITAVEAMLRNVGPQELNAKGKDLCAQMRPVLSKYPFNPNTSAALATLSDLDSIFEPHRGALWQFVNGNLSKAVTRQGDQFVPNPSGGVTVNPAFLAFLNRAAAFTNIAYANNSPDPHFAYSIKPLFSPDQESIQLGVDGQAADFTANNAAAKQFVWPGPGQGVQLTGKFKGGTTFTYPSYDGLWAVFQFVGDADKHIGQEIEMTLRSGKQGRPVLNPSGQPVTVRFGVSANPPIFDRGYFSGLGCVPEVAKP
jgi:type VI secretion system protein ImpL